MMTGSSSRQMRFAPQSANPLQWQSASNNLAAPSPARGPNRLFLRQSPSPRSRRCSVGETGRGDGGLRGADHRIPCPTSSSITRPQYHRWTCSQALPPHRTTSLGLNPGTRQAQTGRWQPWSIQAPCATRPPQASRSAKAQAVARPRPAVEFPLTSFAPPGPDPKKWLPPPGAPRDPGCLAASPMPGLRVAQQGHASSPSEGRRPISPPPAHA